MKSRRAVPKVLSLLLTVALLFLLPDVSSAFGQDAYPPHCDISDSTRAYAEGLDDIMHVFGADTQTYPNEFDLPSTFPAFSQIFDLYVSGSVSARWSLSEWEEIVGGIMSNDTTDTEDDVFGKVWAYFVRDGADANPAHAGVRYAVSGLTYTRIQLLLYDTDDLPSPCPASYGVTCNGWSSYAQDRLVVNASSYQSVSVVLGLGIAHELQHLCFASNNSYGYEGVNESLSTLAEYFLDSWRSPLYDIPYDASVMDIEPCDLPTANLRLPKYLVYRIWMTYLYEVFKGSVGDSTDDLLYRWIRSDAVYYERLTLETLAELLWEDEFDWLGGADVTDRLNRVFGNFLVAKFCNAPDFASNGQFGSGSVNTLRHFGLFLDNCTTYAQGAEP